MPQGIRSRASKYAVCMVWKRPTKKMATQAPTKAWQHGHAKLPRSSQQSSKCGPTWCTIFTADVLLCMHRVLMILRICGFQCKNRKTKKHHRANNTAAIVRFAIATHTAGLPQDNAKKQYVNPTRVRISAGVVDGLCYGDK